MAGRSATSVRTCSCASWPNWHFGSEVVLEELDIPLVHPVDFTGRADSIIEAQIPGVDFTRWAAPLAVFGG